MSFSTAIQASGMSTIKIGYDMLASKDGRERDGFSSTRMQRLLGQQGLRQSGRNGVLNRRNDEMSE